MKVGAVRMANAECYINGPNQVMDIELNGR